MRTIEIPWEGIRELVFLEGNAGWCAPHPGSYQVSEPGRSEASSSPWEARLGIIGGARPRGHADDLVHVLHEVEPMTVRISSGRSSRSFLDSFGRTIVVMPARYAARSFP